jgi:hypothetical protein
MFDPVLAWRDYRIEWPIPPAWLEKHTGLTAYRINRMIRMIRVKRILIILLILSIFIAL